MVEVDGGRAWRQVRVGQIRYCGGVDLRYVRVDLRYARVSSARRDLERQIDALIAAGVPPERICIATKPGASDRPGLRELIGYARDGELISVRPLDRVERTVRDALELIHELSERGIGIRDLVDPIEIDSPSQPDSPESRGRGSARVSPRGVFDAIAGKRRLIDSTLASASSIVGGAELSRRLLEPVQRQREVVQVVIERERGLQKQLMGRVLAPVDAGFDLLEENGRLLHEQAQALETSGRALQETAGLVKRQAELFDRMICAVREPAERAKAVVGLQRRVPDSGLANPAPAARRRGDDRQRHDGARRSSVRYAPALIESGFRR